MRSFLIFLVIFAFFTDVNAANTKLKKYEYYSNQITWKDININLPKGKWMYFSRETESLQNFNVGCQRFLNIRNKLISGALKICYVTSGGKWRQALGALLKNEWQNNKYDSCNLRPEYFYVKAIFKGASSNCFISRHIDPNKELYFPDDPSDTTSGGLKKYIKEKSLKLPKIAVAFESVYFSNRRDKAITIDLFLNPEAYGADKTLFETEESSEYHRNNLDNYPSKKIFLSSWTKKMSIEHGILEDQLGALNSFKLDFSDLSASIPNQNSPNLIEDLNKLNELYKSGILNDEEFEKAKKKILN